MPEELTTEGQIAWLVEWVRDLEKSLNALSTEVGRHERERNDRVAAARKHADDLMREAVEDARADVRRLVGSRMGWEWLSLVLIAAGVVLAAL